MPRAIDPNLLAAFQSGYLCPVFLAEFTFKSQSIYVCSLPFSLAYNGNTYAGTGTLGSLSAVRETIDVEATGISVTLSGVDTTMLNECLADIQIGAPATVYFGAMNPSTAQLIGTPLVYYSGFIDKPSHTSGPDQCSISLAIESRMLRLQSGGQMRRYTTADQRITFPDDTIFQWVEQNNDLALRFGY